MSSKALTIIRAAAITALAVALAGCAQGARPDQMTVGAAPGTTIPDRSPLRYAIEVGTVSGGSRTNPLWKADVADDDFRQALEQSLSLHAMLAGTPRYVLNAQLAALEHPLIEVQATVTATVRYTLVKAADRTAVWSQTLTTSSAAGLGDALSGPERLRLATERAMHENIKLMLGLVIASIRRER
jgi:hypothetical protein